MQEAHSIQPVSHAAFAQEFYTQFVSEYGSAIAYGEKDTLCDGCTHFFNVRMAGWQERRGTCTAYSCKPSGCCTASYLKQSRKAQCARDAVASTCCVLGCYLTDALACVCCVTKDVYVDKIFKVRKQLQYQNQLEVGLNKLEADIIPLRGISTGDFTEQQQKELVEMLVSFSLLKFWHSNLVKIRRNLPEALSSKRVDAIATLLKTLFDTAQGETPASEMPQAVTEKLLNGDTGFHHSMPFAVLQIFFIYLIVGEGKHILPNSFQNHEFEIAERLRINIMFFKMNETVLQFRTIIR